MFKGHRSWRSELRAELQALPTATSVRIASPRKQTPAQRLQLPQQARPWPAVAHEAMR